jgi:nucleotide-binding universal stress UspA family protein
MQRLFDVRGLTDRDELLDTVNEEAQPFPNKLVIIHKQHTQCRRLVLLGRASPLLPASAGHHRHAAVRLMRRVMPTLMSETLTREIRLAIGRRPQVACGKAAAPTGVTQGNPASLLRADADAAERESRDHRCASPTNATLSRKGGVLMDKILIALDGSPSSMEALELGIELAAEQSAAVTLVHVIPKKDVHRGRIFEHAEQDHVLRESAVTVRRAGIEPELKLLSGDPSEEISWLAGYNRADLVVIGSRGRGRVQGTLLGSVSRQVLDACESPVVIVRDSNAKTAA